MSDHYSAEIQIGGKIPNHLLDELVEALSSDGVQDESFNGSLEDREILTVIREANKFGITANFIDDQARYGEFPTTEQFLYKNKIAYKRFSSSYCEFDGECVVHRPDLGVIEVQCRQAEQDGKISIPIDVLRGELKTRKIEDVLKDYKVFDQELPKVEIV